MNARTKTVTIWTALCGATVVAGVLAMGRTAETQMNTPTPPAELVSRSFLGGQPNGNSNGAITSADGRCTAYYSDATNILPFGQDGNAFTDVYMFNRDTDETTRVSVGFDGQNPNGPSMAQRFRPSIDGDCTCVGFSSDASNLVEGDTNRKTDVFLRLLEAETTELVSRGLGGEPANGASSFTSLPATCSQIAFQSNASNLVENDTNNLSDVFTYVQSSGMITRVSVGPGGEEANGASITPSISADGRCIAFASAATNLMPVPGAQLAAAQDPIADTNGVLDIYVACEGVVTCRASVSSDGEEADQMSFLPALNENGTIVAFKSNATNLVPDDRNQMADVFVHDCTTGETSRVSVGDQGQEGNDNAIPPSISGDARYVAFGSFSSNLIRGVNTNGFAQIYVRDLLQDTTTLISTSPQGRPGNAGVPDLPPSISLNGAWVAFDSQATNLVPGDHQMYLDAYIRENVPVAPTPTPTATGDGGPTPTPRIPCNTTPDCPVGQVCQDGFCVPAPTPTPTIACEDDDDCPMGLNCVDGVCRDLSTPTVTPTPLPTCVTDEDCPPGTECKAFVCVPPRPCEDQLECRSSRETCLDGFCECGGDCNTDGLVFGTEITKMVCIWGDECELMECPAGDINQDGEITMADVTLAVINLGLGCPGEGTPLVFAPGRTTETRILEVDDITGIPGQFVNVDIDLAGGGEVTTTDLDILFDTGLLQVSLTEPVCTLDDRIPAEDGFTAEVRLPQVPVNPPGQLRLRAAVVDQVPLPQSFDSGPLLHCRFRINPAAAPQTSQLIYDLQRLEIGDPNSAKFNAQVTGGAITINDRPTCDPENPMCPEGTECKGGECRPIIVCSGPMAGPSECLDNRQACVNNLCVCLGDCNDDGIVRGGEITTMVTIINGLEPVSVCPAGDLNGDGIVRGSDVTTAVVNINEGCP